MKTSTFVVLSFAGLICLAASILWFPLPQNAGQITPGGPSVPKTASPSSLADAGAESGHSASSVASEKAPSEPSSSPSTTAAAARPPAESTPTDTADEASAAPIAELAFLKWPEPKLALVISGEQQGYFEPCGCTANQLGGMSRRAMLFERIRELGWTVRGLEVGGLSRRPGLQSQIKFETTLEALRELQYVAIGLGIEELRLGPDYLLAQHSTEGDLPLKFLGANLVFFGSKDLGTPLPHAIVEQGDVKIGVTSIMSDTIRKEVIPDRTPDEAAAAELNCTPVAEALTEVMQSFDEAGVTFRVLISHATLDESRQLAADFPKLDLIVAANGFGDGKPQAELIGGVRMLQVGEKGRAAGVLGIYPADAEEPVRFELVTMDGRRLGESPRMAELMQGYQDRLKEQSVVTATDPVVHPSGARFVGANKCGECHTKAFEIWKNTPHAHAFESLDPTHKRKGHERLHGVARSYDPECLACHVTGWDPTEYVRFHSGFLNEEFAATDDEKLLQQLLGGNQCENCHGPGSRHVELIESGDNAAAAKEVRVGLNEKACVTCHDGDNSPNFKFDAYWEKVKHDGKD